MRASWVYLTFRIVFGLDSGFGTRCKRERAGNNTILLNVAEGLYLYTIVVNGERKWTGKVAVGFYLQ